MAREQRRDVDYFPHDCTHGRKMHIIETKYGNDGYASWFKLLELLGKANNHYLDISDEMTLMFLTSVFKIDEEKTMSILSDLAKLGAIDNVLFNEHKVVYSAKFCESISDAYRKRKTEMMQYSDILTEIKLKSGQSAGDSTDNSSIRGGLTEVIRKEEKSKVEKRKEEERKEENNTSIEVVGLKNQPTAPKIDFKNLVVFFNNNRGLMPEVKKLSKNRETRILSLEKQYGKKSILEVIEKTRDSPFLQGENKDNWVASFDWVFKPINFLKILEDNYAKRTNARSGNSSATDSEHKQSAVDAVSAMFGVQR